MLKVANQQDWKWDSNLCLFMPVIREWKRRSNEKVCDDDEGISLCFVDELREKARDDSFVWFKALREDWKSFKLAHNMKKYWIAINFLSEFFFNLRDIFN